MNAKTKICLGWSAALVLCWSGARAQELSVKLGTSDQTSSNFTSTGSGTLELRDPRHRWIWHANATVPGDYAVEARVAVAAANAGATLRVGQWVPQHGEAGVAAASLVATDAGANANPQWQSLGTIRISTAGQIHLFANVTGMVTGSPGLLHAIRLTGPGEIIPGATWQARTSACDPGTSGAGSLLRARYAEVIPEVWPLRQIGGTFTTCQAPGGYIGCQESFFWSSWESGGVFPEVLAAFGGTRNYSHEGSGRTISLDAFKLPLDVRRKTLILHKPDGDGSFISSVLVGEAGQGWHLLGRMWRPSGGTTVSTALGFLENPGTFNSHLVRRSSAWANPWFFGDRNGDGTREWHQPAFLRSGLRGPSPTAMPPLAKGTYPWGRAEMRQDAMVKTIGGQIKIAANNTNFPIPVVAAPELPSLALVCQLPEATHVHQVADATVGSSYSASVASLIRDPFTAAPDFTFQKEAGPAWLSVSSGGTLDGTPAAGDAGQNLLTLRVTDPAAGLTGIFTAGVLVRSGTGNQAPVFLDHPAMVRVSAADDEGVVLPLRFHDADAGDTHALAISGGNTGNAFAIDDAGRLVKAGALPADMTWTLTVTVTDGSGASATLPLEVASGSAAPTGGASVEHWFNLPGSAITDLTGSPRYPGEPTIDAMTGDLEDPGPGKNSGTRVRGWIHPPATGDYRFWISAQDRAEFHLSTDDTPGNLAKVCQSTTATGFRNYDASSSQKSGLLALVSGQRYYFEIIQKNAGTTGDFAGSYSVAWQGEGIPSREPVAAAHLSPWRSLTPAFQDRTIRLLPALSGAAYREILRSKLKTLHLYPGLTFSKVSGPAWLSVSPAGEIGGTPGAADAGENVFMLRATAPGGLFDEATVAIAVSENAAPQFSSGTLALPALPEGQGPAATLATFATDANLTARFGVGDRLSFSLVSGPGWLHCEPTGLLFGAPGAADIGTNTFTVAVTDLGGLSTEATLAIQVTDVPTDPVFTVDPIELAATQGAPVGGSLASFAYDPDAGDTLTFAKVSGPAWLAVAADGTLSGTPGGSDGDVNAFTVSVQDALGQSATATLLVTVGDGNPHFHEGFEASAGTPVSGSGSGSGWGGLWSGGTESTLGENVAFPGIDGIAQALAFTGGEDFSRTLARSHGTGHGEGEHPELWLSYVLDTGSPVNSGYEFRLVLRDGATDVLSFGKEVNASWLLRSGSATANLGTGINSGNAGLWFAVVRLTYDGSSTIATGWLAKSTDAALDIADPASFTRTGTLTVPGKISFDRVALLSNNTTTARIDEVSMAASYPRLLTLATAPEFLEDLVSCRTVPDQYFMGTLAGRVESKLADPGLVFTKLDGPAWLMVTPEGDLLGTPPEGLHGFTVAVTDRNGNADTTQLEITATATASLVSESFAGATGAELHGSGSGTGWAAGAVWSRYAGTSGSTKYEAGNSFPGTLSAGGSAALAGGEDLRRTLARSYTLGNGTGEDPALWLSFMVENTGGISPGHEYRLVLQSGGAHVVSFGKEQNQPWRLSGGGTSVNLTASNSTGNSGNWLAMVRMIYGDSSTIVTGWLAEASDPGLDPADASTYARSASVTIPGKASFDQVAILSHNTTSARLDEIFLAREMGALSTGADHDGDSYPDTIDPDDDNDGMPDHWEIRHGLDPLVAGPDLDPDGDGVSDHDEFVADTDPHSAGSRQTLSIAPPDGGTVTLAFPTSTARYYDIEWSDTLDGQSWQSLGTIHAGTGGILYIEEALSGGSRFYRLRVLLP